VSDFPPELGRYQLIERLAVGGMAELFKARVLGAHGFQKTVVIKKILPHLAQDPSFVSMFIDEAKITARLDHPKIAQVLELGTTGDSLFIAMEFVDGVDVLAILRACAHRHQPLSPQLAVHIAHEVLDALEYAHQARDESGAALGVVHRDISPSNVLISRRGDVKLADFGIAHAFDRQQRTEAGMLKGKYGYMSPEQVIGIDVDARSDLFSVGIILAEMLMGRRLFSAPNELDVLLMVRDVRLDRLHKYGTSIPAELMAVLMRALQREPKMRFGSAGEFREELAEWLFSKRLRISKADLAALIEGLVPARAAAPAPAGSRVTPTPLAMDTTPTPEPVSPPRVDVVRPRPELPPSGSPPPARASETSAAGPAPVRRPPSGASTMPPAPPVPVRPRPRVPTMDDIPIIVDEAEKSGGAPLAALEQDLSGPVVTIERPSASTGGELPGGLAEELEAELEKMLGPPAAAAPPPQERRNNEADFLDLSTELDLDKPASARPISETRIPVVEALVPASKTPRQPDEPEESGDLAATPPIHLLYRLAVAKASGLLLVELPAASGATGITKEIFLSAGNPEYVTSNLARELFGEYLVSQRVISSGELAMALAMMPHFGGRLGDTLVGLGLLKPLDVFRHLTRQVREKIVDACTWQKGIYRWYEGRKTSRESFPLGLDAFEVLGAGATALPAEMVETWAAPHGDRVPVAAKNGRVVPEAFRLGTYPRDVYNKLDGRSPLRTILGRFTNLSDRVAFLRTLYLLSWTELAQWI
jgi:eukaryotic-like serine/threonine-protein kinase